MKFNNTMMSIKEYIFNFIHGSESVYEMPTISKNERWGNNQYRIATHGTATGDRENPHIHIYLFNDDKPYNKFNFEISLTDILCYDEINLIYQRDISKNKKVTNRNKCSWEGYRKIKEGFEEWLYKPSKTPGDFDDNLAALIYWYNEESNIIGNALLQYMKERGLIMLDKFNKYFSEEDKSMYKECFNL